MILLLFVIPDIAIVALKITGILRLSEFDLDRSQQLRVFEQLSLNPAATHHVAMVRVEIVIA